MADVDAPLALAAEFPAASLDDWLTLAGEVEPLRSTTYDGIAIEPLYTAADELTGVGLPGFAPFVRGRSAPATRAGWDVRQTVDPAQGRGAAVAELERGATSLWLRIGGRRDVDEALGELLDGVLLDVAPVVLDAGARWSAAATSLTRLWVERGVDPQRVAGSFGADPFGSWLADRDDDRLDADVRALAAEARSLTAEHPNVRVATIDGARFHDRGASDAQELGYAAAAAVETLRAITGIGGLEVAAALAQLELRLAATVDQFATIAKFRAARRLVARIAEVAGAPDAGGRVPLHAVTSRAMATRYDAAVNMLRGTVACFAAAVGGADAITVLPHDALRRGGASELGRRLARNTQTVLALEAHAATVIDAGGGSWYVERFTDELAARAWAVLQEVEAAGGFRAAAIAGIVDERIAATRRQRAADVDQRRAAIVGVSAFPSTADTADPTDEPVDESEYRWAADFEALRTRVDAVAACATRPAVVLAMPGQPAQATAVTAAAANYFGIAGLDTPRHPVSGDADELVGVLTSNGTTVACTCAGADVEPGASDQLAAALESAGATRVYSAAALPRDARAALADLLDHLGVP